MLRVWCLKKFEVKYTTFVYAPSSVQGIPHNAASSECEPEREQALQQFQLQSLLLHHLGLVTQQIQRQCVYSKQGCSMELRARRSLLLKQICAFLCK